MTYIEINQDVYNNILFFKSLSFLVLTLQLFLFQQEPPALVFENKGRQNR